MGVMEMLIDKIRGKNLTIVYPEATDKRILGAAIRHHKDGYLKPILLGHKEDVREAAEAYGWSVDGIEIINPRNYNRIDEMVDLFVERRKGKVNEDEARRILRDRNYFGTMLVYMGLADGMVSGAVGTTGDTIRPGLQIIKTKPGINTVSGAMVMIGPGDERFIFADTAVTIQPTPEQLADIAAVTAETAKLYDVNPVVALLSFSTMGSAKSPEQEKVAEAARIAKEKYPNLRVDGEMQFDAALIPSVGARKAPQSRVAGHARVFVFPDIQSGNIGYKIAERLGGFEALGPILQGMAKPINDLSRGCSEEDAYKLGIITAASVDLEAKEKEVAEKEAKPASRKKA